MVDYRIIKSMLWVYGPPATEVCNFIPSSPRRKEIPFLPFVTAVDIDNEVVVEEDSKDGKRRGTRSELI
jgi:hypothetical protein